MIRSCKALNSGNGESVTFMIIELDSQFLGKRTYLNGLNRYLSLYYWRKVYSLFVNFSPTRSV
jgi:hypothetical protein